MQLFRSEEHLDRWLDGRPRGAIIPIGTLCDLANRWWDDRLEPDWRPHAPGQNQAILDDLGLAGEFWRLP